MKKLLKNIGLKTKMFLMLLFPLGGMIYFSVGRVISENEISNEMGSLQEAIELSKYIGDYIHESQKERGFTAGFLKSNGEKFSSELTSQRNIANEKKSALNSFLEGFDSKAYGDELTRSLQNALAALSQLEGKRSAVSAFSIEAKPAIGYYTDMHSDFLATIGVIAKSSSDAKLTTQLNAYANFLLGKERAGIERAVLTGAFASDQFGTGGFEKFIKLVSEQDAYYGSFLTNATSGQTALYNEKMGDGAVRKVEEMRDSARIHSVEGAFGVDAGDWFSTITMKIDLLKEVEKKISEDLLEQAEVTMSEAYGSYFLSLIISILVFVIALLITIPVAVVMVGQIKLLNTSLDAVAQGDLTVEIDDYGRDEFSSALKSLKIMVEKLKEVISKVVESATNISEAGVEMSDSSQQMSEGATEQASAAEEISSSMEEMVANIQQNTDNAKQTEKIAESASGEIQDGSNAVNETVDSMRTIANKISIIGEISRQTNLLALNAAVEAARAGEHGKGFAVVAAEVRKLAERSQIAATEIDELSATSVDVAQKSGSLLKEIVPNIQKTADLVQEITAASVEQNTGADQINNAIQQLNEIVQQNAATAEELAASSEQLNSQSEYMTDLMGFFNTGNEHSVAKKKTTARPAIKTTVSNTRQGLESSTGVSIDLSSSGGRDTKDSEYEKF